MLGEDKHIPVTLAEEQELLSPQQAADRFEERSAEHERLTAEWSRDLDELGAPAE